MADADKVADVQSAADALAQQRGVGARGIGEAAVGIHVREVELTSALERIERGLQHLVLGGAEVDHAVGDDEVDGAVLDARAAQVLDEALPELHVGLGILE